jgi:hypothetical protein
MNTIQQFVENGITTLADLQDALRLAIQLEFSTIPPYLCAQWSIDSNEDPDNVADMIQKVVMQEMFHFALTGNMLTAVGGVPDIAKPSFLPTYPTHALPGGIAQALAVDLQPLSVNQVKVFMQIEQPEFPPVALSLASAPATIGAFYGTVADGFTTANPVIDPGAKFVAMGEAVQITSIADALVAIARIKGEGEGTPGSPDQPPAGGTELAHYYLFKQIFLGKTLVQDGAAWSFSGPPLRFPKVFPFRQSDANPNPSKAFNQTLTRLLTGLQNCWVAGQRPSVKAMRDLETIGRDLIQQGIRPEFIWAQS